LIYLVKYVKISIKKRFLEDFMKSEYLEGGKIIAAHGVKGLLKVEHFCDSAKVLARQKRIYFKKRDGSYEEREVISASLMGETVLMGISGIDSREAAQAMRGVTVFLNRQDIPLKRGEMFLADIIGLPVLHAESGERLGEVVDADEVAGRRLYTVRCAAGDRLLPDVKEFIKEISEEGMRVLPIPGLLSDDEI
jgi:16S rRNA processing protein RimM